MFDKLSSFKKHASRIWCVVLEPGREIPFRCLTSREYLFYQRAISTQITSYEDIVLRVFEDCVLDSEIVDQVNLLDAGIIFSVAELCLSLSGNPFREEKDLSELDNAIDFIREEYNSNPMEVIYGFIIQNLSGYTLEKLESMEFIDVLRLFVIVESSQNRENPIRFFKEKQDIVSQVLSEAQSVRKVDSRIDPAIAVTNRKQELIRIAEEHNKAANIRKLAEKKRLEERMNS